MARRGTRGRADAGDATAPDPRLRALHATSPAKFTAARDALARALAAEGSPQAVLVARLRRPPRATWLVNAVAQERPEIATALLEAGDRLRQAQSASLGGDVSDLRAASATLHTAVDAALAAARQRAAAEGRAASAELLREVTRTLRAAATADRGVREAFRQGMLRREPEAVGPELLTALAGPDLPPARPLARARPPASTSTARPAPAPRQSEVARGREEAALRRRAERAAAAEAAARERQRRREQAAAERLERARRAADARLARADAAVADAERRLAQARRAAEAAREAAARSSRPGIRDS